MRAHTIGTMASHHPHSGDLPPGHVPMPVVLTGSMGLAVAAVLHLTGWLAALDHSLATAIGADPATLTPAIPPWSLWIATATIAYGLSLLILEIPGHWRRLVIWTSSLAVIAAWLPVAFIAHRHAPVAAPLVAAAWSGLCGIIYAARHHMRVDDSSAPAHHDSD